MRVGHEVPMTASRETSPNDKYRNMLPAVSRVQQGAVAQYLDFLPDQCASVKISGEAPILRYV